MRIARGCNTCGIMRGIVSYVCCGQTLLLTGTSHLNPENQLMSRYHKYVTSIASHEYALIISDTYTALCIVVSSIGRISLLPTPTTAYIVVKYREVCDNFVI